MTDRLARIETQLEIATEIIRRAADDLAAIRAGEPLVDAPAAEQPAGNLETPVEPSPPRTFVHPEDVYDALTDLDEAGRAAVKPLAAEHGQTLTITAMNSDDRWLATLRAAVADLISPSAARPVAAEGDHTPPNDSEGAT